MMKFDNKAYLAERIKYHRKQLRMTQAELAKKVDLTEQHISRIESGCYIPSLKSFFLLAEALQIDLREFGFNPSAVSDACKNALIEKIINCNERELILYKEVINSIHNGLLQIDAHKNLI